MHYAKEPRSFANSTNQSVEEESMSKAANAIAAKDAIQHVFETMTGGSTNKNLSTDYVDQVATEYGVNLLYKDNTHIAQPVLDAWGKEYGSVLDKSFVDVAKELYRVKIGNCGARSWVAAYYLAFTKKLCRISCCELRTSDGASFHEFVVIGADPEPLAAIRCSVDSPPLPLGQDAVWCDPWAEVYFLINADKAEWICGFSHVLLACGKYPKTPTGINQYTLMASRNLNNSRSW
jgi:hypothetical protein